MQNSPYSHTPTSDLFADIRVMYAGFWERFGAAILDSLILILPNYLLQYFFGNLSFTYFVSAMIMRWLYDSLQESSSHRATLGKRALGIKVTDLNGEQISFLRASGRHFGKYVSAVIILIGYLMMLWSDKKQTLHDLMAGTLVVKQYGLEEKI